MFTTTSISTAQPSMDFGAFEKRAFHHRPARHSPGGFDDALKRALLVSKPIY